LRERKAMLKLHATFVLILLSIITINASTYYVDQVTGNNNNSGLSESSAWKTITKVNSFAFQPGDNILFRSGQLWREKIYFTKSGTSASRITFGAYGAGEKPIISGADLVTGFTQYSGNVWSKSVTITVPQQLFFNNLRGVKKASRAELVSDKDWYYDTAAKILYLYSLQNPSSYTAPGIEASSRDYAIYITADYVTVRDIQIEKTSQSAITFSGNANFCIVDNITMYQWTNEENSSRAGVLINGKNCSVLNSTFGRNTGDDIADQNWAGYLTILSYGNDPEIANNFIYHNSTENENKNGNFTAGIKINLTRGTTKIYNNYIYHTGSNAIYLSGYSLSGDVYEIYNNQIHYPGQAGIALYKTRSGDGIGGIGYVYGNTVTYANRLGGEVGGNGNQSAGIHFNDGVQSGTESSKPFMKWYCYENNVSNSQALKIPNGQDSDGIALDFNANNVEVYRNILYNNYGKGLYIWNADNCKVYYNIIYGNDAGCTVTAQSSGGGETSNNNEIYNNTFYKNYNGSSKGPNYNTEIYFGGYGKNNIFRNNIIYASASGFGYYFSVAGSSGCITDNNIVYSEGGLNATVGYDTQTGRQTFTQWRKNHPDWDANSINADPLFAGADQQDFSLTENSPAINSGIAVGLSNDYSGKVISGTPDIGAMEFSDRIAPALQSVRIINDVTLEVAFTKKVNINDLQNAGNYSISGGVAVTSAAAQSCSTRATLTTSAHNSGTFTLSASNIKDYSGNVINPALATGSYSFISVPSDTVIRVAAEQANLSGSAALKVQAGSIGTKAAYFSGSNGAITFSINIPKSGNWYLWGRMYYGNTSSNNSFNVSANNVSSILGDDNTKYNRWHYDGYNHSAIPLGYLNTGQALITISPRETGETVLFDQVLVTLNESFVPQDEPSVLPVTLASPAANAADQPNSVDLVWNKDALAQSYGIQVSTDPQFLENITYYTTTSSSLKVSSLAYSGVYYWRVKSIGGGLESDWSETRSFTCKSLLAPVQANPLNLSNDQQLQLNLAWTKISDAKSYFLQVAEDAGFASMIFSDSSVSDTVKAISGLAYNKKYYWRVRSIDNQYSSDWSPVWSFTCKTLAASVQAFPADNSVNQPLQLPLKWNKNPEAAAYSLQVSTDSAFGTFIVNENSVADTFKIMSSLQYGEKYYWRIRSDNNQFSSEWSPAWSFTCKTLSASVQAAPADNSFNQPLQITLVWNKCEDADSYALQVSTDAVFDSLVINETAVTDTFRLVSALKYSRKYYWRIRSIDKQFASGWSSAWSFTAKDLSVSAKLFPADNSQNQPVQVTLIWNKNSEAASYGLQVSADAEFSSLVINELLADTARTISSLSYGGTYYWRINSINNGYTSDWSPSWNFTTKVLQASAQVLPQNNTVDLPLQVTLTWNKNSDAGSYGLQVSSDSLFSSYLINESSVTDTFKTINGLGYGQKYYWRINSKNNGTSSDWSATWNFTCKLIAELVSPVNGIENVPAGLTLKWRKSAETGTTYFVQVSKTEDFSTLISNDTVFVDTMKSISQLASNTKYFWRVKAVKGSLVSEWSPAWSFKTMPVIIPVYPENNTADIPLDITINWKKEVAAVKYHLQVSKEENFGTLLTNDSLLTDTVKSLLSLDYSTKYYWRVRFNDGTNSSDWSQVWNFTTIPGNVMLFRGMDGTLSGDVRLGTMTGMRSTRSLYFVGTKGGSTFTINIPKSGIWYLWARMYYMSSGEKNSFFAIVKGQSYVLGDDDNKYNKWHWDGFGGRGINLGNLNEGNISVVIAGREPGLTLWVDQFILTDDPNYDPNIFMGKSEEITGVEPQQVIPDDFGLNQNFPNPFNPSTTIRFAIPHEEHTTLKIYDILGGEVATLVNESLPAGTYNFNFNASDMASGIYLYQLRAGSFVKTCKMQLLK
jgi:parallel beta-helix repeat protein